MRLYESVVLWSLLYSAESWPLTATSLKRMDGACYRWRRGTLSVSWKDKITNQEVRWEPNNAALQALSVKEDYAGLIMCCEWITGAFHSKHYTGRFKASRGDRVGQGQTGEAKWRKICKKWDSHERRQRWQLSTDQNGISVWPNTPLWTWDEPRTMDQGPCSLSTIINQSIY